MCIFTKIFRNLHRFKIGGRIYDSVLSFFNDRRFFLQAGSAASQIFAPVVGVPQGSPLSSTLFLVAFQSILDTLKNIPGIGYSAYADDLLIFQLIVTTN